MGDGAAPLNDGSGLDIFNKSADDTDKIDSLVFVKAGIFSGDEGLLELDGYRCQRNDDASLLIKLGNFAVIVRIDSGDDGRMVIGKRCDLRKVIAQIKVNSH